MSFRQAPTVGAVHQRDVPTPRLGGEVQQAAQMALHGCGGKQVIAPDDLVYARRRVVNDDRQLIGRQPAAAEDHEVAAKLLQVERVAACKGVVYGQGAVVHFDAPRDGAPRFVAGVVSRVEPGATRVGVGHDVLVGVGGPAGSLDVLSAAHAGVGLAHVDQTLEGLVVGVCPV